MFKEGQEVKYVGDYFTGIKDVVGYIEGEITGDGFYLVHYPSLPENFEVCCDCHLHDVWGRCDKKQYLYIHKSDLVAVDEPTAVAVPMVQDSVSEVKFNVGDKVRYIGDTYYKLKDHIGIIIQLKTEFGNTVVYYPSLPSGEFVGGFCLHNKGGKYDEEKYICIDPNDLELVKQPEPDPAPKPEPVYVRYVGNCHYKLFGLVGEVIKHSTLCADEVLVAFKDLPAGSKTGYTTFLHNCQGEFGAEHYVYFAKDNLRLIENETEVEDCYYRNVKYIGSKYKPLVGKIGQVLRQHNDILLVEFQDCAEQEHVGAGVYLHDGDNYEEYFVGSSKRCLYVNIKELEEIKNEAKIVYLPNTPSGARLKRARRERLYREVLIKNWDAINKGTDVLCINELCNGATLWSVNDPYVALQEIEKDNPDLEFIVVNSAGEKMFHLFELSLRIKHKPKRWDIKK